MTSTEPSSVTPESDPGGTERELALKRVQRKRKLVGDAVAYVVVNAFLVGVWLITDRGYFWPGWVMGVWGMLLLLDVWNVYLRRPITEADVEREMRHGSTR